MAMAMKEEGAWLELKYCGDRSWAFGPMWRKREPTLIGKYYFVLDRAATDELTSSPADGSLLSPEERFSARGQSMEVGYLR